ncbi:sigma-54-dependent transcriptional regulator [Flexibacterium corallicola]|uniref:sigma-54-dependent transcriptional regulator n=1 Tax=Flexibacterium corallicola TaxID=3037259 RepID=UPI00286F73ED|nr:sigma-54 dependent transcriptional regulator [Pseudovibrio sp. M1P-2-3]
MAKVWSKILLVEDTYALLEAYKAYLLPDGYSVSTVGTGQLALEELRSQRPEVIVLDVNLPDMYGLDILREVKASNINSEVIVVTGQASVKLAVEAMRMGAFDFIMKPFSAERLRSTVKSAVERYSLTHAQAKAENTVPDGIFSDIIGNSEKMQKVYRILTSVAPSSAAVFIRGESGTGKELCAIALHKASKRSHHPFITINCAAIPKDLLESEIFGHIKGAFTGASSDRKGAALCADKGTLFLDEVCEMDLGLQSKLLRFLQEKQVQRVGEDRLRSADVRIVCATNRDPLIEIAEGRFREDLYYRLHVVPINLPPLRERHGDVILLGAYFLRKFSIEEQKKFLDFSEEAKRRLTQHLWPGNIRQLQNAIRNAVVLNDGEVMHDYMLPEDMFFSSQKTDLPVETDGAGGSHVRSTQSYQSERYSKKEATVSQCDHSIFEGSLSLQPYRKFADIEDGVRQPNARSEREDILPLETVIRLTIERAIRSNNGSIPKAAAALEVSPSTIYRRLQVWEEERKKVAANVNKM